MEFNNPSTTGETSAHETPLPVSAIGNDIGIINPLVTHHAGSSNGGNGNLRAWQETVSSLDESDESPQENISTIGNTSSESPRPRKIGHQNDQSKDTSMTLVGKAYVEDLGQRTSQSTGFVATNPTAETVHGIDDVYIDGNPFRHYAMAPLSITSSTTAQYGDQDSQASHEASQSHVVFHQETMSNTEKDRDDIYLDVVESDGAIERSASPAISEAVSLFTGGEPGPDVGPWKRVSGLGNPMDYDRNRIMPSADRSVSPIRIREFVARQDMYDCVVNRVVPPAVDLPSHVVVHGTASGGTGSERSDTVTGWTQRIAHDVPGNNFGRIQAAFPSIIVPDQNWTDFRPVPAFYVHGPSSNQSSMGPYDCYKTSLWVPASHHQKLDRPIFIANPLDYVIYDGTCKHCEVNCCPCLNPTLGIASNPHVGTEDGRIITEGFCRHCILAHCRCVVDPQWGQRHAKAAKREALSSPAPRLLSDAGTVRRYNVPEVAAGSATEPSAQVSIPERAHIANNDDLGNSSEVSGAENNGIIITIADPARDLEAQYTTDDDTHSVSVFRMSPSERAARRTRLAPPSRGHSSHCFCRTYLVSCIMAFVIIVGVTIWVSLGHDSATS